MGDLYEKGKFKPVFLAVAFALTLGGGIGVSSVHKLFVHGGLLNILSTPVFCLATSLGRGLEEGSHRT